MDKLLRDHWLGVLAPKRHAKRAVTRNLLKRQMRSAFALHFEKLPPGLWLLRLRSPFATRVFPSARSVALAAAMRAELVLLLMRTKAPCPPN